VAKELFERFGKELNKHGLIVNKGKIIDATIIEVPVQRNSRESKFRCGTIVPLTLYEEPMASRDSTLPLSFKLSVKGPITRLFAVNFLSVILFTTNFAAGRSPTT
jgi:hypothetical protein